MNKKVIIIISLFLVVSLVITGCKTGITGTKIDIKSQEAAGKVITNVTSDIGDVSSKLEDINKKLG